MTNEYISKQYAVNAINDALKRVFTEHVGEGIINPLKPADVAPVVHSRWIKTEDGAECENCGREAVYQIVDDHWEYEPWCPHCGAKMDKE